MAKIGIAIWAVLLLTSCAGIGNKVEKGSEKAQLCGGYTRQRPPEEEEFALFNAVTEQLRGVGYTPESVATQVVAGTNYRFICTARSETAEPETYRAEITVFAPLPGRGEARVTEIRRL